MTLSNTTAQAAITATQQSLRLMGDHDQERRLHYLDEPYIDWILDKQNTGSNFYKVDITFNSSGSTARPSQWLEYYNRNVVYKIQKVIGSKHSILHDIREYEFGIKSRNRVTSDWRCPHHIHALIGVPSAQGSRMMSKRLKKDLESLAEVSSVYIDLIPDNDTNPSKTVRAAYAYMRKGKTHRPLGAD